MWPVALVATFLLAAAVVAASGHVTPATDKPITVVAIGDSLTAGLGVQKSETYTAKLEAALRAEGQPVTVVNSGVSGDTSAGGRARLDWALGGNPGAVIIELGANDALRGLEPSAMYDNLSAMLAALEAKNIPVLLAGMRAPPNLGDDYAVEFEAVYRRLAREHDVIFYPFFLKGVAADPRLNQDDGMHPTAEGYDVIVRNMMPFVRDLLARARSRAEAG